MLYKGLVLDLIGSSEPWKDHGVHGSRLDVVSSGVQAGHLGQRKNTLPLRQDMLQGQQELQHGLVSQMFLDEFGCVLLALLPLFPCYKTGRSSILCPFCPACQ